MFLCVQSNTWLKIISSWPIWNPSWITMPWRTTVQNAFEWVPRNAPKLFHMRIFAEHRNHCIGDLIRTRCHCDNSPQYLPQWYYITTWFWMYFNMIYEFTIIYGNPFFNITKKLWVRSPLHSQIPYFLGAPFSRAAHEAPPRHHPDLPETFLHRQLQASLLRLAQGRYLLLQPGTIGLGMLDLPSTSKRKFCVENIDFWPCLVLK